MKFFLFLFFEIVFNVTGTVTNLEACSVDDCQLLHYKYRGEIVSREKLDAVAGQSHFSPASHRTGGGRRRRGRRRVPTRPAPASAPASPRRSSARRAARSHVSWYSAPNYTAVQNCEVKVLRRWLPANVPGGSLCRWRPRRRWPRRSLPWRRGPATRRARRPAASSRSART